MASGSHYGQGREFRQLNQGKPHGFLHHVSNHSAADKNMKEVRGSQGGGGGLTWYHPECVHLHNPCLLNENIRLM